VPTAFDDWLTLAQTAAILLLWLFYVGRWVGKQERRPPAVTPPLDPPKLNGRLTTLETELGRARDRLHKLEGFQQVTETRLRYIERNQETRR
jgi:hypothetical protein